MLVAAQKREGGFRGLRDAKLSKPKQKVLLLVYKRYDILYKKEINQ